MIKNTGSLKHIAGLLLSISIIFSGCGQKPERPFPTERFFGGEHQIQKLVPTVSQEGYLSGGFFLFVGSINGSTHTEHKVKFAWKSSVDDSYILSSFPLEKIRIRFDTKIETPTVRFQLNCKSLECDGDWALKYGYGQQYVIDRGHIEYAVITVKPEHWPAKIQMPLQ